MDRPPASNWFHAAGVDDTTLLRTVRGICDMLIGSATTGYVVQDIATHLGTTMEAADQVMDGAMGTACQGLTIDNSGAARPTL
jgi:hypothetical protein